MAEMAKANHIVEFGAPSEFQGFIWLQQQWTTGGRLITTELRPTKAKTAQQNFSAAGLADFIEVRTGNTLKPLAKLKI
jgi:predicted O-methyltransferase YrrM